MVQSGGAISLTYESSGGGAQVLTERMRNRAYWFAAKGCWTTFPEDEWSSTHRWGGWQSLTRVRIDANPSEADVAELSGRLAQ